MSIKKIILCSAPKIYFSLTFGKIYGCKIHLESVKGSISKIIINDDLFSASDYRKCDNEAAACEDSILKSLLSEENYSVLTDWGSDVYSKAHLGREILKQSVKIFRTFRFAEKVSLHEGLQGTVYVWPEIFSWRVYKKLRSEKLLPDFIQLPLSAIIFLRIMEWVKFFWFFTRFLFYPEFLLTKMRSRVVGEKKELLACVYVDDGIMGFKMKPMNLIVDKKTITKEDVIFVHEESQRQVWEKKVSSAGYQVLNLGSMIDKGDREDYLKSHYLIISKFRWKLFCLSLKAPWFIHAIYKSLRLRILWELFYKKYSVSTSIRMMVAGNLTSTIVQKKNDTITQFLYFSTTEDIVDKKQYDNRSTCLDYTHMIFDQCVSSLLSNQHLEQHQNYINKYISIGPIFSDLVHEASTSRKHELRGAININNNATLISFLDHTTGYAGVLSFHAYHQFLLSLLSLAESHENVNFAFKSKKSFEFLALLYEGKFLEVINKIRSHARCVYINDFELSSFELVGISDVVVSAPLSSVIFESLSGGIKTISYDPGNQYGSYQILENDLPNMTARTHDDLNRLIKYWLYECDRACFETFKSEYVISKMDSYCDGMAIERYRKLLCDNTRSV